MAANMRAKFVISQIQKSEHSETLYMNAVCKPDGYPADGSDEDNTYAMWTPSATLRITINNPNLIGKFAEGEKFYLDFTPVA